MKLIIAGGRDYFLTESDIEELNALVGIEEVVSGNARGVDRCGEKWAEGRSIPVKLFPAEWDKHGRGAGHIRNAEMAKYADAVALFPGGRGTDSMYKKAMKAGLTVFDFRG